MIDFEWWENIYLEAERIGLIITDFDLEGNTIEGKLDGIDTPKDVREAILAVYEDDEGVSKLMRDFDLDDEDFDEKEFKYALLEEYLSLLKQEYEYLSSVEALIET